MRSGGLRHRITILKMTTVRDSIGYEVETWTSVGDVWGEMREERSSESLQNDRPIAFRRAVVFIRYRSDIGPTNKLKINGVTWNIEGIRTLENQRRTEGVEISVRTND